MTNDGTVDGWFNSFRAVQRHVAASQYYEGNVCLKTQSAALSQWLG